MALTELSPTKLAPTRDYLQQACLVLSALQRAFLPEHPRQWQYGLEVGLRGLVTQEFTVNGQATRASLDLVRQKVRLGEDSWPLRENPPAQIMSNIKAWLQQQAVEAKLDEPKFKPGILDYDFEQVEAYAENLWWMDEQFRALKAGLKGGVTAPILLYPHHFDLSLVWFPFDDERQVAIGWSTGDETIHEPYLYLTAYPEPPSFKSLPLPAEARWQSDGFSGAVLLHSDLAASRDPAQLLQSFAAAGFQKSLWT